MLAIALLFASGLPFFIGVAVIGAIAGTGVPSARLLKAAWRAAGLLGVALVLFSATPLPLWLYVLGAVLLVLQLALAARSGRPRPVWSRSVRGALVLCCLLAMCLEARFWLPPRRPTTRIRELYVIGDFLSADTGIGETLWPTRLATASGAVVHNLAVAGATTAMASKQADALPDEGGAVVVAIGGNDVVGGRPADEFKRGLEYILARARDTDRPVVMIELPLPPFANGYGAVQRELAARYRVALLPKWRLARILATHGATTDGLHLSDSGHELLAREVARVLASYPGG